MSDERQSRGLLSAAGAARRERMLVELTEAMGDHHRRRRKRRRVASSACGLLVVVLAAVASRGLPLRNAPLAPRPVGPGGAAVASASRACEIRVVRTDPGVLDRYRAVATARRRVEIIDDDMLLADLRELNRPTGLVRMDGRVYLTAAVADRRPDAPPDV